MIPLPLSTNDGKREFCVTISLLFAIHGKSTVELLANPLQRSFILFL